MRIVLAWILALSAAASAQEGDRGDRAAERMLERMKERLNLSDEQATKIKELSQQGRESEEKARVERDEKIKELLNDEQKKQYEEFKRNPWSRGSGGGGSGGAGSGWLDRFLAPAADQLKKDLGLSDEQADKVKVHLDEFNERARARFEEMRQNGFQGLDWQAETQKFQENVKDLTEKVKQHLNDEQKGRLDKLLEERFNLSRLQGGGGGGTPTPGGRDRGPRRPSVDERVKRVMEALKIETAEDAAAVRELVKKCVEAQYALEDYEGESHKQIEDFSKKTEATEDEIKGKIDELRGGRRERDKTLKDCQKSLAEIVTYRQELELIKQGILR